MLSLSVREFELLAALARREGRIVTREELYALWGGAAARRRPLGRRLRPQAPREARATALPEWRFIHTHFGFGYRFQPEPSHPFHKPGTGR